MPAKLVLGISGNIIRPSKTLTFVDHIAGQIAFRSGGVSRTFDIQDLGTSLGQARQLNELEPSARDLVELIAAADVLVVGSPTYKGSYTGLFKHFLDLLDPAALRGKPVILAATGGGERHSLIVEHQLRPLFGFFEALTMPTAIYATAKDFAEGVLVSETIQARAQQAVIEACRAIGATENVSLAA
ncbi:FMN reductase [Aminobacter sp. AP02]|uniref:FMN reductase n=1 Tax=Aminobacter sp. AP02 TaxID=2135737 RepID=UPI000D6B6C59|nr:FMN reductase [Aminobacter sp. AP02]PWK73998.1 FMN reductase [Aminobacter sp. AP02]